MKSVMKKLLLVAIVATMAVLPFALTACSGKDLQLDEFDTLTVATNAEFPPWETMDDNGNIYGIDIDIIKEIGKRLGKKVVVEHLAKFSMVIAGVESGTHLTAIAGLTINSEREESVSFTRPYYDAYQVVVVKDTNTTFDGLTTKEEVIKKLEGANINVAQSQTGESFAKGNEAFGYDGIKDAKIKHYDSINLAIQACTNDSVALSDDETAKEFVKANKGYKIIDIELTREQYGIITNRRNKTLWKAIDEKLGEIIEDGTMKEILAKYGR